MSWQASKWAARQTIGSSPAKAVLLVLAEAADDHGFTFLGHAEISRRAEVKQRTVIASMRKLEGAGLVSRERRWNPADGSRTSNGVTLALQSAAPAPRVQGATPAPRPDAKVHLTTVLGATDDAPKCTSFTLLSQEPVTNPSEGRAAARAPAKTRPAKKSVKSPAKKAAKTRLAGGFPDAERIARAQAKFAEAGVRVDAAEEAEKFREHHGSKGSTFADWQLAFLGTWCRRAIGYARVDGRLLPPAAAPAPVSEADEWAGRLRRWERSQYWDVTEWGPKPGQPGCRLPAVDGADVVPLRRRAAG